VVLFVALEPLQEVQIATEVVLNAAAAGRHEPSSDCEAGNWWLLGGGLVDGAVVLALSHCLRRG
jgi:hypothetical protein